MAQFLGQAHVLRSLSRKEKPDFVVRGENSAREKLAVSQTRQRLRRVLHHNCQAKGEMVTPACDCVVINQLYIIVCTVVNSVALSVAKCKNSWLGLPIYIDFLTDQLS